MKNELASELKSPSRLPTATAVSVVEYFGAQNSPTLAT
jgi:hypothetical protein